MLKYFGTDGIRGKSPEWLNEGIAYKIGYALGHAFKANNLFIGRDTRASGYLLNQALNQGAIDSGLSTINLGIVSTPMVQYLSLKYKAFGIMITASHNPAEYNGIKVIVNGNKVSIDDELIIEKYIDREFAFSINQINGEHPEYIQEYIDDLKSNFSFESSTSVFLDTANGSLANYADEIISSYSKVKGLIGNHPNGNNINENVGSTHIKALIKEKPSNSIGLAFDGDGDRLIAVDEKNEIVTGDIILSIINEYLKLDQSIVFTKMLNPGIRDVLNKHHIKTIETDIGDKYIKKALDKLNLSVGGEDSGHMIFNKLWPVGDGLFSALLLLEALENSQLSLHEAAQKYQKWPEILINVKGISKNDYLNDTNITKLIEKLVKTIQHNGKLLVRPSGTEPLLRIFISHRDREHLYSIKMNVLDILKPLGGIV